MSDLLKKPFLAYLVILLFLVSCSTVVIEKRKGTGRPKFASLEIDGITYELRSSGSYSPGKVLELFLKLKNSGKRTKKFEISKNRLAGVTIKNEYAEDIYSIGIKASDHIKGNIIRLTPGSEREFRFVIQTSGEGFRKASEISARVRLLFLSKKFRRNSLSVFVEKED